AFDADDQVDAFPFEGYRQAVDRRAKPGGILHQRGDVVKENPGFREIGHVPDLGFEMVHIGHRMLKPVSRPVGIMSSTSTRSTRACGGPCLRLRSNRSSASASPSAETSTRPSGVFLTQPRMPSRT